MESINLIAANMGLIQKAGATPSDVHINRPLTNLSVAFMQDQSQFVASRIFPSVPVQKQSDTYFVYNRGDFNRNEMKKRAPATESAGGTLGYSTDTYFAHVYAVHFDVNDQLRANADEPLNPDRDATAWLSLKGLLFREIAWATDNFKTGVWTTEKTGVAATPTGAQFLQWNDAASDPVANIKNYKNDMLILTGIEPNTLVLGQLAYTQLTENNSIMDRIKYGQTAGAPAQVTRQALAQLFEIDRVEVLKAIVNTGVEGAADSNAFISNSKAAALFYVPSAPGLMTPSAGYTFVWTGYAGAGAEGGRISSFRMENIKSDRVELEMAFAPKKVAADLGIFMASAVA